MNQRPGRTLGISLAIILTLLFYTIIPLVQVGFTIYIRQQTSDMGVFVGSSLDPMGGSLGIASVTNLDLILRMVPAMLYLGIAGLAWRGKPQRIRFVMVAAVMILFLWYVGLTLLQVRQDQQLLGMSSDGYLQSLRTSYFTLAGLVAVYTLWYMNRAPARAYYRGYYLEEQEG